MGAPWKRVRIIQPPTNTNVTGWIRLGKLIGGAVVASREPGLCILCTSASCASPTFFFRDARCDRLCSCVATALLFRPLNSCLIDTAPACPGYVHHDFVLTAPWLQFFSTFRHFRCLRNRNLRFFATKALILLRFSISRKRQFVAVSFIVSCQAIKTIILHLRPCLYGAVRPSAICRYLGLL